MRDDPARLLDIILACRHAREHVEGMGKAAFRADRKTQAAVMMELEVIGEAARSLSDEFRASQPQIPWPQIVGLRHRIAHEYFRMDLDILWQIVQTDVPALAEAIGPLVPPNPAQ